MNTTNKQKINKHKHITGPKLPPTSPPLRRPCAKHFEGTREAHFHVKPQQIPVSVKKTFLRRRPLGKTA